ncbi:MAG: hypothetical protein M3R15_32920 [Acidobacteriota bacterium]|nr:hypothetical protein [Acidobacteriota bacterium]
MSAKRRLRAGNTLCNGRRTGEPLTTFLTKTVLQISGWQPIDGSPLVQVTNFRDGRIFNFAYSPDGKQLALSRSTFDRDVVLISNSAED